MPQRGSKSNRPSQCFSALLGIVSLLPILVLRPGVASAVLLHHHGHHELHAHALSVDQLDWGLDDHDTWHAALHCNGHLRPDVGGTHQDGLERSGEPGGRPVIVEIPLVLYKPATSSANLGGHVYPVSTSAPFLRHDPGCHVQARPPPWGARPVRSRVAWILLTNHALLL